MDQGKGDPISYPYHDYLFRSFVQWWNRATPEDILIWYSEGVLEEKLGCRPGIIKELFPTPADFISDLERWWRLYNGMGLAKRIQAPPILQSADELRLRPPGGPKWCLLHQKIP
ncbi:hypothetical protein N752_10980 [Desulforamulus aquiferis]|nr:hypothetical protein [Desulforamulus aquiferis]RYD05088.1 hypothetical protein N752_10980 [Desulforamulus aquiferis]